MSIHCSLQYLRAGCCCYAVAVVIINMHRVAMHGKIGLESHSLKACKATVHARACIILQQTSIDGCCSASWSPTLNDKPALDSQTL